MDTGCGASALSLSELEESESEPDRDEEEDDDESVSESESPLSLESDLESPTGSADTLDTLGATVVFWNTAGAFLGFVCRRRRWLRE